MSSISPKDREMFEKEFQEAALPLVLWLKNHFPENVSVHVTHGAVRLNEAHSVMLITETTETSENV